jgi:hypothetical protein
LEVFQIVFHQNLGSNLWNHANVLCKIWGSANEVTPYRPISLLPIVSKLFEKLPLKRLKPLIESKNLIPSHQFGFRDKHATTDQMHRITNIIERAYEENKICSAIFLDIAQAFDKVWHVRLMNKLKKHSAKTIHSNNTILHNWTHVPG